MRRLAASALEAVGDVLFFAGFALMWVVSAFAFVYGGVLLLDGQWIWGLVLFLGGPTLVALAGLPFLSVGAPFTWLAAKVYDDSSEENLHDRINRRAGIYR